MNKLRSVLKKRRAKEDPRVRRRLFSWRMFAMTLLVVSVLSAGNVFALEKLLKEEAVTGVQEAIGSATSTDPRLRSLTPQERRILLHVAQGMTNRQIGAELFLAEKTVKNYITAVLAKLGMERRTQAAVFAATHAEEMVERGRQS